MAKVTLFVLLALCLTASGVALGRMVLSSTASGGTIESESAGKHLVSSLGAGVEPATLSVSPPAESSDRIARPCEGETPPVSAVAGLRPNFPNPFSPTTTVSYCVPRPSRVVVTVHDVSGRVVATLADGWDEGSQVRNILWSGETDAGDALPSGVYFLRMIAEGLEQTRKMVLLR